MQVPLRTPDGESSVSEATDPFSLADEVGAAGKPTIKERVMPIHTLKPCPRCEARSGAIYLDTTSNQMYCRCKACGHQSRSARDAEEAVANWNGCMEPQE